MSLLQHVPPTVILCSALLAFLQTLMLCILYFVEPVPGWGVLLFLSPAYVEVLGVLSVFVLRVHRLDYVSSYFPFHQAALQLTYVFLVVVVALAAPWALFRYGVEYLWLSFTIVAFLYLVCLFCTYVRLRRKLETSIFDDVVAPACNMDTSTHASDAEILNDTESPDDAPASNQQSFYALDFSQGGLQSTDPQ